MLTFRAESLRIKHQKGLVLHPSRNRFFYLLKCFMSYSLLLTKNARIRNCRLCSSATKIFVQEGPVNDVVLSPTVPPVYFLTVENWYKAPAKILASLCRGRTRHLRPHSGCATAAKCWSRLVASEMASASLLATINDKTFSFLCVNWFNTTYALPA